MQKGMSTVVIYFLIYLKLDCAFSNYYSLKWKNCVAEKNEAYKPTYIEHVANIITHGVCVKLNFIVYSQKNLDQRPECLVTQLKV